ncbi:Protein of unknown function [Lactobacillus delbrueckii subsp. bulgaricus]|nr:Protein of unknown function [Lactobacillus delbrueckii subsp. bulgaricus]
MLLDTS